MTSDNVTSNQISMECDENHTVDKDKNIFMENYQNFMLVFDQFFPDISRPLIEISCSKKTISAGILIFDTIIESNGLKGGLYSVLNDVTVQGQKFIELCIQSITKTNVEIEDKISEVEPRYLSGASKHFNKFENLLNQEKNTKSNSIDCKDLLSSKKFIDMVNIYCKDNNICFPIVLIEKQDNSFICKSEFLSRRFVSKCTSTKEEAIEAIHKDIYIFITKKDETLKPLDRKSIEQVPVSSEYDKIEEPEYNKKIIIKTKNSEERQINDCDSTQRDAEEGSESPLFVDLKEIYFKINPKDDRANPLQKNTD